MVKSRHQRGLSTSPLFRPGKNGSTHLVEQALAFQKIEQRFQKREAFLPVRREYIRDNNDKTGLHPITGEVVDPKKHVERNGRDIDPDVRGRGPRHLPERTPAMSAFDERRARRAETRRPIREDFILKEGLADAPPDRLSARDNFVPPSSRLPESRTCSRNASAQTTRTTWCALPSKPCSACARRRKWRRLERRCRKNRGSC